MDKRCQRCGCIMQIDDWYAYIRRKYCPRCAADVHRMQNANRMAELRRITRQQHEETKKLCAAQQEELQRLRELVIRQREQITKYK